MDKNVTIYEVELGPHFLTFYTKKLEEMLDLSAKMYKIFILKYPELADIQQKDFKHEENDPKIYHPFGEPNDYRPWYRHFHIRYARRPNEVDISSAIMLAKQTGFKFEDLRITNLEDYNPQDIKYPQLNLSSHTAYLKSIDEVRNADL